MVAGAWAGAIAAIVTCPYRLAWRYDRAALRIYSSYSVPIFIATACSVILANATVIATNIQLGLSGVGAVALAGTITVFTVKLDDLVSGTLYPVICAVQSRVDLLYESFVKSNRLAMIWAMPFGLGLMLFAPDLVHFGIGEKWQPAIGLLQVTGVVAAISQIGFNWDDYFRARAQTVPIAVAAVASTLALLGVGLPLLSSDGLTGLAIGIAAGAVVQLAFRAWYLGQMFEGFMFFRHALRALLPVVPAIGVVLLIRLAETGPRTLAMAIGELVAFVLVVLGSTWLVEGPLVREAAGYVGRRAVVRAPVAG